MNNRLLYKVRSGKPPKFIYLTRSILKKLIPAFLFRGRLKRELAKTVYRSDWNYIEDRVNYYNKLSVICNLPDGSRVENQFRHLEYLGTLRGYKISFFHKAYYFDAVEYTRWFNPILRWGYCPGDVYFIPKYPAVVKSRLLRDDNINSVILKLDKFRHFMFVNDKKAFEKKQNRVIFRGKVRKSRLREQFLHMYFYHPMCDCGVVGHDEGVLEEWLTPKKTIREHLDYKFIMALEGNDVASNLKWVMSSNSIAVMPRPTCETWFMEGRLIPNYHYIEIKQDLSDLEERLAYYIEHTDEAQQIIKHAHEYVSQFYDSRREDLISLLVLEKYFQMTGQKV